MKVDSESAQKRALKASIGYTLGNYLLKGIGFLTVPLFARIMSTSDFGILNTFLAYEAIIYIFIGLTLHTSLKSARIKYENNLNIYVSSIFILPIFVFFIFVISFLIFNKYICSLLDLNFYVVLLLLVYSYFSFVIVFYRYRVALDYNYKEFIKISFFNVFCGLIISLYLMYYVFYEEKYYGRIIGITCSYFFISLYITKRIFVCARPTINIEYWKYGLNYSLPLIPHGLSQVILLQFDRIMINKIIGSAEAGIYSFAYTLYALAQIMIISINSAFEPWAYEKLKNNEIELLKRISSVYVIIISFTISFVMLSSPEMILFLGGEKYKESIYCVLPIMLSGLFSFSYYIPAVIEYYFEKTKLIAVSTTIAAILNVILNLIFIKIFGYIAAAYTTVCSYVVYFFLHIYFSRKFSGFYIIDIKVMLLSFFFGTINFLISLFYINNIVIRIIVICLLILISFVFGKQYLNYFFILKNRKKYG